MKHKVSLRIAFLSFMVFYLIQDVWPRECGWAHRIERFLLEEDAMEGSWPWMVAICRQYEGEEIQHLCSGVLITRKHVLTIATYYKREKKGVYMARIGHVDERLAKLYKITQVLFHTDFKDKRYYNDIAIMTLEREVFSVDFNPICLPTHYEFRNLTGQYTTLVGWGSTTNRDPTFQLREKFGLMVIPNPKCNETLGERYIDFKHRDGQGTFNKGVTDGMICTAYPNDCIGESGSALMYQQEDQWYIVGMLSFSTSCKDPGSVVGYSKVSEYLDWIHNNTKDCGVAHRNRTNVSVDSGNAPDGSWPWMASIMLKGNSQLLAFQSYSSSPTHLCSGSLITSRHVLTSSSCFFSNDSSLYLAVIGSYNDFKAPKYNLKRIVFPPHNVLGVLDDDIAILTLELDVRFKGFNPICLPIGKEFANLPRRQSVTSVGWERTQAGNANTNPRLRENFDLQVIPNSECNDLFSTYKYNVSSTGITSKMVCTAYPSKCVGDTGSPLMYQTEGRWYVIGLMSFSFSCDAYPHPTAYTRVSKYLDWIDENTQY